jgi:NADH:ubiquinone oxidoreductase subunit F (NADH-binding)/ferredoxin
MSPLPVLMVGPPRLTLGFDAHYRIDWAAHRSLHGHPRSLGVEELIRLAEAGHLCGRGGAAFPFARKVRAVADAAVRRNTRTVVVVNGTEGEPGSAKDKVLMARAPHLILDGAVLAATALGATEIVVGVTEDQPAASMRQAIEERGVETRVRVARLPERFITGQSGALIRAINGGRPIPPSRKRHAYTSGVDGRPTLLSNVETFAQLALLAGLGVAKYRSVGTADEPGTVLLTVGGAARYPAVVETPAGAPLAHLLDLCGASMENGVLIGGYHGRWLAKEQAATARVSRESLAAAGGALGAGVVLPLGRKTCPLGEAARVAHYLAAESAGQCGPCRLGLPDVAGAMTALALGQDGHAALETVHRATRLAAGRGACNHPDGVARFAGDISVHLARGTCGRPVLGLLPAATDGAGLRLEVDWSRCDGHGLCADIMRGVVRLDGYGYPVLPEDSIAGRLEPAAHRAVAMCPSLALRLVPRQDH